MMKIPEHLTLKPLLQRPESEFLINFMYDFLLRTHTQKAFESDMIEVFGEVPVTGGMTPEAKEEYMSMHALEQIIATHEGFQIEIRITEE